MRKPHFFSGADLCTILFLCVKPFSCTHILFEANPFCKMFNRNVNRQHSSSSRDSTTSNNSGPFILARASSFVFESIIPRLQQEEVGRTTRTVPRFACQWENDNDMNLMAGQSSQRFIDKSKLDN